MRLRSCFPRSWPLVAAVLLCASLPADAQDQSPAASRQYNSAVGLHNNEAYDLAAQEWLAFIQNFQTDPRIPRAHYYLGICQSKQNELEEAAKTFTRVLEDYPDFDLLPEALLNLGLTQYNIAHAGKTAMYETAAATFHTLATKYPQGKYLGEAIFYQGECLYNRGKKKDAAEKYSQVVAKHADHSVAARALFALGVTQADLGQHQTALATYQQFLEKHPQNALVPEVVLWRGESQYALKEYTEAAKSYAASAATEGFSMADYATVRQADALAAQQKYAAAADLYASVPEKFPDSQYLETCNLEAGKKYYAAGVFRKADQYLGKVVAAGGKRAPEAAHWAARSLLKQGKPAEALAVVEKTLSDAAQRADQIALLMDQADAVYEIPERRGEAVGLYAALAEKHPKESTAPQARYMAAFAAMNLGDHAAALNHAQAFLDAYPDHELAVGVKHIVAESNLLSNKFDEAEQLYDELLAKWPDDRDAEIWKVHRGTARYLQKKYQETVDALQPVIGEIRTPELLAEAWYRIGRSQAALQQFDAAAKSLEESLVASPKWKLADDARLVLAYAYQQGGELGKAKSNAQQVIRDFPDSKLLDMAHYRLGECCRLEGQLKAAVGEYQQVLDTWPQTSLIRQTLYGLGWAQLGLEDYAAAEEAFTTLIEKHPGDNWTARAQYGRAMARRQLKKFGPAEEDIQAFLATDPPPAEKSRSRHVLGLCQKGQKKFEQAAAVFRTLLQEDPEYTDADSVYFELGWALKSLQKEQEAADAFGQLVQQFPDSALVADSQCLIGDFHYDQKKCRKAAVAYHAAMTKAGKTPLGEEATYKLGLAYYLMEDFKDARQTFNYQRVTWPDGPMASDATFMEAECYLELKEPAKALAQYELVTNPSSEEAKVLTLLHAGTAAAQLKQWDKSLQLLDECMEKYPDSSYLPQALYEKGWAQQNLGRLDEALLTYADVIARSNGEPAARAQFMIGEIQFQQKKYEDAIKSFFKVSYGYGYPQWQADATYEAARCFEVLRKKSQALKQYQKLLDQFPDSDKVPLAKERIKQLQ